jgi:hypothetical protein
MVCTWKTFGRSSAKPAPRYIHASRHHRCCCCCTCLATSSMIGTGCNNARSPSMLMLKIPQGCSRHPLKKGKPFRCAEFLIQHASSNPAAPRSSTKRTLFNILWASTSPPLKLKRVRGLYTYPWAYTRTPHFLNRRTRLQNEKKLGYTVIAASQTSGHFFFFTSPIQIYNLSSQSRQEHRLPYSAV